MRLATPLLLALLATAARAQTPGDCALGQARADLAVSDVRATLLNTGSLFFGDGVQAGYVVPAATGRSPVFAAGIWVGGKVDGQIRAAASRYGPFEFWPGPLDGGAALPEPDCRRANTNGREAWDRIYVVSTLDVEHYEQTGQATDDLADWPVGLGAPAVDAAGDPVVPTSRDQLIDLEAGERPVVYGSQTAFWVMNDVGNDHAETGSDPLGVEVRVSAFSVINPGTPALDQGTFYRYTVVNRNSQPLTDAYLSLFVDPDLGDAIDDYVGSDTTRGLGFVYNGDNSDAIYGIPPAFGVDGLSHGLGAFSYFNSTPGGDPSTLDEYYNFMQGLWGDGTPMTEGGSGYQTGGDVTAFAFPGDPVTGQFWSEVDEDNSPGDRRFLVSSPSFTLAPGASRTFDLGFVFAQGTSYLDSITELRAASDLVQARYDDGSLIPTASEHGAPDAPADYALGAVHPNPSRAEARVAYTLPRAGAIRLAVYDALGREVAVLADGLHGAGAHEAVLDGAALAPGVYVVVLEGEGARATAKLTILR